MGYLQNYSLGMREDKLTDSDLNPKSIMVCFLSLTTMMGSAWTPMKNQKKTSKMIIIIFLLLTYI